MMKFQEEHCRFYVKCSKCSEQIPIVKEYKKEDENLIRCQHCKNVLSSQSLNDWIIYKEELWNGLLIDYSYFHLISLEKKIYREDKEQESDETEKLNASCAPGIRFEVSVDSNKTVEIEMDEPNSSAKEYNSKIAKDIGTERKTLAREFGIDQRDIDKIIAENNGSVDDQCAQMLSMYASRKGRSYTKRALVEALFKSGLRSVAEDHSKAGYPKVSNNCQVNQDHDLTLPEVPGLKFHLPAQCITTEATLTMTVYYADPPYNQGLPIQKDSDGNRFIQLSPIVRLEPDGYQFTPNSTRKALLQVPVPYINQIVSLKKNNNFNIPIKIICRSYGCEKWEQQDIEYEYSRDKNGYYCLTFAVSHFSEYAVISRVKSFIYSAFKYILPSRQQRIKTLAFLSEIDTSDDTVHMKLILAKKDVDETAILSDFHQEVIRIRLVTTGLENTILKNGDYEAKFKEDGLDCPNADLNNRIITINWNEYSYHAIDYACKVIKKAAINIAQISLKLKDPKRDTKAKICYLRRSNSNKVNEQHL
ncbi:uncharacterized protein TRIADDRAFT_62714 [Trichoplax adhaerens]|uniref:Death domain-containing protein n=1 Tax=Trichoplax adhaerens TaxID=10228 RepID=B3SEM7_TRIAD|nr:predicted protein [Trichoplax adhaerens]EDV18818.1 predicted protein [Trichoplax adhaerens]|eukprot:XP_002118696.1 predicted protein [Trichoplax adhaerens]